MPGSIAGRSRWVVWGSCRYRNRKPGDEHRLSFDGKWFVVVLHTLDVQRNGFLDVCQVDHAFAQHRSCHLLKLRIGEIVIRGTLLVGLNLVGSKAAGSAQNLIVAVLILGNVP